MTTMHLLYLGDRSSTAQQASTFTFNSFVQPTQPEYTLHYSRGSITMRDLYYFALARKRSLMSLVGRESEDPRCRRSRVRMDYEYDLSTPSAQSLAAGDQAHAPRATDAAMLNHHYHSHLPTYQQGSRIVATASDSCLLLDPPTTKERFERIEAALNEVDVERKNVIRRPGSKSELHPNLLLRQPTTRDRYNRIESAITDTLNKPTHQLRRKPSFEDLGLGAIVRGRENRKRSASTNTLLKRWQPTVSQSAGDGQNTNHTVNAPLPVSLRPGPKPQPRSATTNETRHLSRDLIKLLASDGLPKHSLKRPNMPFLTEALVPADSHSTRDLVKLFATESPISGSVSSHKPNIIYRLPPVLPDHEDDIFRSPAALEQMLDEAKRSVERQIYQESQTPPWREESAIHSPRPSRVIKRRSVADELGIGDNGADESAHKVSQ